MATYLVRARPRTDRLEELKKRIDDGEIRGMKPFGKAMHHSLTNARVDADGVAAWEEVDYCQPPLAMERAAVLDDYFTELTVEPVEEGRGGQRIDRLPALWAEAR